MHKKFQKGFTLIEFIIVIIIIIIGIGGLTGYVLNIVEILEIIHLPIDKMLVFRCIGVFVPPLGAILGYV